MIVFQHEKNPLDARCVKGILLLYYICSCGILYISTVERAVTQPPRGGIQMETYEFLTFLVVFTILVISVKR